MMFSEIFAASMLLGAAQDAAAASANNPVAMIEGEWAVVDSDAGRSAEAAVSASDEEVDRVGDVVAEIEQGERALM